MNEEVRRLWKEMGVEAEIKEITEVNIRKEGGKRMAVVKLRDREGKREVMKKKIELKGRKEKIENDWTKGERRMQWRLQEMAREKRKFNRRAEVRYAKIWMRGRWWRWNEEGEGVVNGEGRKWGMREGGREREIEEGNAGGIGAEEGEIRGEERREEGEGDGSDGEEDRKREIKTGFWNVAGLTGKDEEFWERVEEWDVVRLMETWLE